MVGDTSLGGLFLLNYPCSYFKNGKIDHVFCISDSIFITHRYLAPTHFVVSLRFTSTTENKVLVPPKFALELCSASEAFPVMRVKI